MIYSAKRSEYNLCDGLFLFNFLKKKIFNIWIVISVQSELIMISNEKNQSTFFSIHSFIFIQFNDYICIEILAFIVLCQKNNLRSARHVSLRTHCYHFVLNCFHSTHIRHLNHYVHGIYSNFFKFERVI